MRKACALAPITALYKSVMRPRSFCCCILQCRREAQATEPGPVSANFLAETRQMTACCRARHTRTQKQKQNLHYFLCICGVGRFADSTHFPSPSIHPLPPCPASSTYELYRWIFPLPSFPSTFPYQQRVILLDV